MNANITEVVQICAQNNPFLNLYKTHKNNS